MQDKIVIFDTTLRDGEQAPGAKMSVKEKVLIAQNLDMLGVDVIECGFAVSSDAEFEAISEISKFVENSTLCSLARANKNDIKIAYDALIHAKHKRLHTFISTSEVHMKHKLGKTPAEVLEMIKTSVGYAKELFDDVEWSAEDATRTDFDFLCKCVEIAIANGAKTINLPDTVGYAIPQEYRDLFVKMNKEFGSKNVIFSSHCHDDLGMSVANSISAILGGARQIECTILGIGERAGNATLEEIVMAVKTRSDMLPYTTNIKTKQFVKICELVSSITGFFPMANKAIVGRNAFAHESGVHQDGMLKCSQTYEIMNPADVGFEKTILQLGKLSGRNALDDKLKNLGFSLTKEELDVAFVKFKTLCDSKKKIYDNDIIAIVSDSAIENVSEVKSYSVNCNQDEKLVSVKFLHKNEEIEKSASANGIFKAAAKCIDQLLEIEPMLEKFEIKSVSLDTDSQGIASVIINFNNKYYTGNGHDIDIVMASIRAYLDACLQAKF